MGNITATTYGEQVEENEIPSKIEECFMHSLLVDELLSKKDSKRCYKRYKRAKKCTKRSVSERPFSSYYDLNWVTTRQQSENVSVIGHHKGKIVVVKSPATSYYYLLCEDLNPNYASYEDCLRRWDFDSSLRATHTLRFRLYGEEKHIEDKVYCISCVEIVQNPVVTASS